MRIPSIVVLAALLVPHLCAAGEMKADEVFARFAREANEKGRNAFLKANAGTTVDGAGNLEAMTPRRYFDTSIPASDATVALIQVAPDRKVVCGLPRTIFDTLGWLREGAAVGFEGKLADAHDWGQWTTLYLSGCELTRRLGEKH